MLSRALRRWERDDEAIVLDRPDDRRGDASESMIRYPDRKMLGAAMTGRTWGSLEQRRDVAGGGPTRTVV